MPSSLPDQLDDTIEEIVAAASDAEQARQLAHDDGEPRPGLEADQNAVADQPDEHAELEQPGEEAQNSHREGSQARDLGIAHRIAAGERADRAGDHQRNRGGRAHCELSRGSEQCIANTAKHVAVDADLRR